MTSRVELDSRYVSGANITMQFNTSDDPINIPDEVLPSTMGNIGLCPQLQPWPGGLPLSPIFSLFFVVNFLRSGHSRFVIGLVALMLAGVFF